MQPRRYPVVNLGQSLLSFAADQLQQAALQAVQSVVGGAPAYIPPTAGIPPTMPPQPPFRLPEPVPVISQPYAVTAAGAEPAPQPQPQPPQPPVQPPQPPPVATIQPPRPPVKPPPPPPPPPAPPTTPPPVPSVDWRQRLLDKTIETPSGYRPVMVDQPSYGTAGPETQPQQEPVRPPVQTGETKPQSMMECPPPNIRNAQGECIPGTPTGYRGGGGYGGLVSAAMNLGPSGAAAGISLMGRYPTVPLMRGRF